MKFWSLKYVYLVTEGMGDMEVLFAKAELLIYCSQNLCVRQAVTHMLRTGKGAVDDRLD